MGKVTDHLYDIYVTQETSCAEAMLRAGIGSRRQEIPEDCCRMMSGYSGGVSTERFCGAVLGGAAAIGYLINGGDEESFEKSKTATEEFVNLCTAEFQTDNCHEIKTVWRKEGTRCYDAVEKIAEKLELVLKKYVDGAENA